MSLTRRRFIETASLSLLASATLPHAFAQSKTSFKDRTFSPERIAALEALSEATFKDMVGERFVVSRAGQQLGSITLVSVDSATAPPLPSKRTMVERMTQPSGPAVTGFSLRFKGSATFLPQGTYTLGGHNLDSFPLFLVSGGPNANPHTYTAVFSQLTEQ